LKLLKIFNLGVICFFSNNRTRGLQCLNYVVENLQGQTDFWLDRESILTSCLELVVCKP